MQILRGVAATLTWTPVGSDGEPLDTINEPVTVGVTRADGTVVLPPGTAATVDDGVASVQLDSADTADLDLLTATWVDDDDNTATTSTEIVGGYLFSVTDARTADQNLANDVNFPTALLVRTRAAVEEEFEEITGTAFVPRFAVEVVTADQRHAVLRWAHVTRIRFVEQLVNGEWESWTAGTTLITDSASVVQGLPCGTYRIGYEHGLTSVPDEVKNAGIIRLRDRASQANRGIPARATAFQVDGGGTYRLDQAGARKTGIPDVDAALARWCRNVMLG